MPKTSQKLTEEDVKHRFISPAIERAGWDKTQMHLEFAFTAGQVLVEGRKVLRGKLKKVDYLLNYTENPPFPLAIVEAKAPELSVSFGIQQALDYAGTLDVPFVYSSNGSAFFEHDCITGKEREIPLNAFPSPQELWERFVREKNLNGQQIDVISRPYYFPVKNPREPRYYQRIAIDRTLDAIARGEKRILVVMATGTGKTFTAFQIAHRFWSADKNKRILYLADRNILIDQTMQNDFKPFKKVMTKINARSRQNGKIDTAHQIYMSLYQQLVGENGEEHFKQFAPGFFDLVIVDECHRGSARDDSTWRKILEYFSGAIHLGMTATPKETNEVSTSNYFNEPIFTYSLKQGIEDGFLAPYRVLRETTNLKAEGWRPEDGQTDKHGNVIEDVVYGFKDLDRKIIIDEYTQFVARRITQFLRENNDRFAKTIVFCVNIDHAERMRVALVNENADLVAKNPKYIMRITGDSPEGKAELENFIDPATRVPAIVTTSKLLTTGVDCKTCKLIVIDNMISSISEFKQIIGRGTRLVPDYGKHFFTIMDFRDACNLFADPEFDGPPIPPEKPMAIPPIDEPDVIDDPENPFPPDGEGVPATGGDDEKKAVYHVNGVKVELFGETISYYGLDGKLHKENLIDYTRKNILGQYTTLEEFLADWNNPEKRNAELLKNLCQNGVFLDELRADSGLQDVDDFDLICHYAWGSPLQTKKQRANSVRSRKNWEKYSAEARRVLEALLEKYQDAGVAAIDDLSVLNVDPFRAMGAPQKIVQLFGNREGFLSALRELKQEIYAEANEAASGGSNASNASNMSNATDSTN